MKTILIILILGVAAYFGWQAIQTKPDASVPQATVSDTAPTTTDTPASTTSKPTTSDKSVDNANVKVSFKGFGPGKEHYGSFSDVQSSLVLNKTNYLSGSITVGVESLKTENDKVTAHLKTADFFDVAKYPTATFKLSTLTDTTATGLFTIHGVTKTITFPIKKTLSDISAMFTLSLKDFGISQTFANETIELSVLVPLK